MQNMHKLMNRPANTLLIKFVNRFSTNSCYTTLKCNDNNGLAVLDLHNKPANVLNWHLLTDLRSQFKLIEKQFSALILTSSLNCFSSGADLNEFYSRKRVYDYIKLLEEVCIALYSLPMPTIAAINGHAIAGGCVIANACDYRFIVNNAKIGLNESAIGISIPYFVHYWPVQILGYREGTRVCREGQLLTAEQALSINWVDAIAQDQSQLIALSVNKMEQLTKIPVNAYAAIKKLSQLEFIKNNNQFGDELRSEFVRIVNDDQTNARLESLINSISKKKTKN